MDLFNLFGGTTDSGTEQSSTVTAMANHTDLHPPGEPDGTRLPGEDQYVSYNGNEVDGLAGDNPSKKKPGSQPSKKKENTEAIVADLKKQLQETQDELIAFKANAREVESELKNTKEELLKALQRAKDAEAKVPHLSEPKQSRGLFGNRTKPSKQSSKTNHKTVTNLEKILGETQDELCAFQANASEVESQLRTTNAELQTTLDRVKEERDRLFQMLSGATIHRDNRSPPGSFPDGDQITKMARETGTLAWDYVVYTSYFLQINPLHSADSSLWRAVGFAEGAVKACVEKKTKHLTEFTEGEIPPEESLGDLFWKSTMQHVVKTQLNKSHDSFLAEWVRDNEHLKTIVDRDEKIKDKLKGRNIVAFMELHFKLGLACCFSDPECFLWPAVGTTVPFSPKHHISKTLPNTKSMAKPGESVHVVYPGLYFRHPKSPDCEPVVRAMVAVL